MSSDTAKENASVVDSSVTGWRQDMGNSEDPESSSYKANDPSREDFRDFRGNSAANKKGKLCDTRYFIIKSLNHHNIQLSIEKGIWATQVMNEPILEEAFHNSGRVILIFSINMSGFFQGYAQMMSSVGWRRDNIWSQGSGKCNPWGRSFKVKWLRLNDLPFQKTLHLKNPLNDYKTVKISRDCQELSPDIGEALCDLLDGTSDFDGLQNRDDFPSKRPCLEPSCSLGDEEYDMPPWHMSWSQAPMLYSSLMYQHQAGASRYQLAHQRTGGTVLPEYFLVNFVDSKVTRMKHFHLTGFLFNLQVDRDVSSQFDAWGLSGESPPASVLTEDEFLEMSYEEYLEAHSRSSKKLCIPASGRSLTTQDSSKSKKQDNADSSRKRTHCSSQK
ncbi:zinc finger CCCH domain-containing protein 45 isoform X2 [Ziziphus jujuba]|uniref:YTH domain-containing family protein n=1 Tax=Ziziphus jujuba TaxID=326968 RepID=A0ABM3I406_ZIZJJ|nr:zinc finger CCCH domain-containing protein 45 isoform X2 [Ziziphus jujuba]